MLTDAKCQFNSSIYTDKLCFERMAQNHEAPEKNAACIPQKTEVKFNFNVETLKMPEIIIFLYQARFH